MKKFLKPSLLSMTLALTLAFAAAPLTSHAAEIVPVVQATTAVSSPVVSLQGKKGFHPGGQPFHLYRNHAR